MSPPTVISKFDIDLNGLIPLKNTSKLVILPTYKKEAVNKPVNKKIIIPPINSSIQEYLPTVKPFETIPLDKPSFYKTLSTYLHINEENVSIEYVQQTSENSDIFFGITQADNSLLNRNSFYFGLSVFTNNNTSLSYSTSFSNSEKIIHNVDILLEKIYPTNFGKFHLGIGIDVNNTLDSIFTTFESTYVFEGTHFDLNLHYQQYTELSKDIILRSFSTSITKYIDNNKLTIGYTLPSGDTQLYQSGIFLELSKAF